MARTNRVAFVTYLKGDYGLHVLERREEIAKVASSDFGSPGPIVDFQAPLTHTLVDNNKKKKGKFEKLFLEGRPPVALGVTSGGDVFGGTQVVFTDVLGDQQISMFVSSVSQYRTMSFSWLNLEKRLQWALQGYSQTQFYYGQLRERVLRPGILGFDRSRLRHRDTNHSGRDGHRDLPVQPLSPPRAVGRVQPLQ